MLGNIQLCMHHICLPKGLHHISETSGNTYNGLYGCHNKQYTINRYTPSQRTQVTLNNTSTHIVRKHTPFLQIYQNPCVNSRRTISPIRRCSYSGQKTTAPNIQNLQPTSTIGDISARYKIIYKYIGIMYDETQAVVITEQQYLTCLHANGQFCKMDVPFHALKTPPTCTTALYTKNT